MPATTFLGNAAKFTFAAVALEADLNSLDINFKNAALDDTCFGDSWESRFPGLGAYNMASAGFVNKTAGQNDATLFGQMGAPTAASAFTLGLAGSSPGNPKYTGNTVLTDIKEGVKVKALATLSFTMEGRGAPVRGTY